MPRRHGPETVAGRVAGAVPVDQEPAHGFALASLLARDGDVGMVWHVQKGEAYRAVQRLERLGLIAAEDKQYSLPGC